MVDLNKALHNCTSDDSLKKRLIKTVLLDKLGRLTVYPWNPENTEYLIQNARHWFPHMKKGGDARIPYRYNPRIPNHVPEEDLPPTCVEKVLPFALRICWKGSRSPYAGWSSDRAANTIALRISLALQAGGVPSLAKVNIHYIEHRPEFGDVIIYPSSHSERAALIEHAWLPGFYYSDANGKLTTNPIEKRHFSPSSLLGISCCPSSVGVQMKPYKQWEDQNLSLEEVQAKIEMKIKQSGHPKVAAIQLSGVHFDAENGIFNLHLDSPEDAHILQEYLAKTDLAIDDGPSHDRSVATTPRANSMHKRKQDQRKPSPKKNKGNNQAPKSKPSYTPSQPVVTWGNAMSGNPHSHNPRHTIFASSPTNAPTRLAA